MVVSIPVSHPEAPPRTGMVRGFYESIEMIREIPVGSSKENDEEDAERNPVEWIMVTRSDPGGGIPRFMVERSVPSSIVQDAVKFLNWACARKEGSEKEPVGGEDGQNDALLSPNPRQSLSITDSNGITAGIGTSIADRPSPSLRRLSQRAEDKSTENQAGFFDQLKDSVGAYIPDAVNPMQRTISRSSSSTSSSLGSFASAEQFNTAPDGPPGDAKVPTPSSTSQQSLPIVADDSPHARELQKIEEKKLQLQKTLDEAREKQNRSLENETQKTQKEMEKAAERHEKERKKQEDKFQREIRKLEERREKETKKLLARQQKEANNNQLQKAQRERDEYKQRTDILEQENKVLTDQIRELQRENTALVAKLGKTEIGREILKAVKEDGSVGNRTRASSKASRSSDGGGKKSKGSSEAASMTSK